MQDRIDGPVALRACLAGAVVSRAPRGFVPVSVRDRLCVRKVIITRNSRAQYFLLLLLPE